MINNKWIKRYIDLAKNVAEWSKDPSTKVGAVVVGHHGQILSQGYNGFPRKIRDTDPRLSNREEKYKFVVHAEMNCIYNACLNGVSLKRAELYVYGLPVCHECAKGVIQTGIKKVIACYPANIKENWKKSFETTKKMLEEAEVTVLTYHEEDISDWDQSIREAEKFNFKSIKQVDG